MINSKAISCNSEFLDTELEDFFELHRNSIEILSITQSSSTRRGSGVFRDIEYTHVIVIILYRKR